MNIILYVGMDVHSRTYTLCTYRAGEDQARNIQKMEAGVGSIIKYLDGVRGQYFGCEVEFQCGYEAGCLGYELYRQLTAKNIKCTILAPSTIPVTAGKKRIKTDARDAVNIAKCLANGNYSPVAVPTAQDERVKEYLRMREDFVDSQRRVKQRILAFCLRKGKRFTGTRNNWTDAHRKWLRSLVLPGLDQETLNEYLLELEHLEEKISRIDKKIGEIAAAPQYAKSVGKLRCFLGIENYTALSTIVEISDFHRFKTAKSFSAFLGLIPGEHTSDGSGSRLPITKAGNSHLRKLLVEAAQCYSHGKAGYKSKKLLAKQEGNPQDVITYADRANTRLRNKYYKMVLHREKNANVAKIAIARELACFIWGMMTDHRPLLLEPDDLTFVDT